MHVHQNLAHVQASPVPAGLCSMPLEVDDITKVFGPGRLARTARSYLHRHRRRPEASPSRPRAALDGVSFRVPEGEIYGVLGAKRVREIDAHPHPEHFAVAGPGNGARIRSWTQ